MVLQTPFERIWAATQIPHEAWAWARPRRTQVTLWELIAALCGVRFFLSLGVQSPELVVFIDNTAALNSLLRGTSRQTDLNEVLGTVWFELAAAGVFMHAHYVPSALNLADGPTRANKAESSRALLDSLFFKEVCWRWPAALPWQGD